MMPLFAPLLAATLAVAQTTPACAPVPGIGCVYIPSTASDGAAPLFIYFRGWLAPHNGSVPAKERVSSAGQAFTFYGLGPAADAAGAVLLVTGSSDVSVRDADVDALEKQLGRRFTSLILAAHSGGYVGLGASLPPKRKVERVIMLDDFYFDDSAASVGRAVADVVQRGAACAGYYTPHNKDRWEQRFKPYLTCPVEAFGPNDHNAKVNECLKGYATTGTCH
jgi:hypothetical protein